MPHKPINCPQKLINLGFKHYIAINFNFTEASKAMENIFFL